MRPRETPRWILAFDASCERCRAVSDMVRDTCSDRIELLPLAHTDVERWRREVYGAHAPWTPTLIRVDADGPRAWTGPALGVRLLTRLGPVPTLRLIGALSRLRDPGAGSGVDRKGFLRAGAGLGVAVGLVLAGRTPALADASEVTRAQTWARTNRGRLPERLDAFGSHSMTYRRAIFGELSPRARSRLWVEHLDRYRREHPEPTAAQREVLERAGELLSEPALFTTFRTGPDAELDHLKESAIAAFGEREAHALLATLGPPEESSVRAAAADCTCSQSNDWCGGGDVCAGFQGCTHVRGCGLIFLWICNGHCR
ncbi:bacteriocin fulvocin C-related protein [Nocardiopsis sp. N85]|uniref:bacteriocin fulvocin C-related protein n=1 Tax=Nocardiopsis sp. N85 TaxID=3029400 RepID=UPI00237FD698|nr:bacteriocin fulvocin C-related protein [Nocardiopsis sp. N85]MDE3720375.1 bacteriocin fulvocin C-related protein [Nocardiopsis sp. N85]